MAVVLVGVTLLQAGTVVAVVGVTNTIIHGTEYGGHHGISYDYGKGDLFISNVDFHSVTVISDASHTVVANVSVGTLPYGIVYDSGRGRFMLLTFMITRFR